MTDLDTDRTLLQLAYIDACRENQELRDQLANNILRRVDLLDQLVIARCNLDAAYRAIVQLRSGKGSAGIEKTVAAAFEHVAESQV